MPQTIVRFMLVAGVAAGCRDPIAEVPVLQTEFCAPDRTARVACVLDGDTVDLDGCGEAATQRVRFLSTAAPEVASDGAPAECYGDEARDFLTEVALDQEVRVLYDTECVDIYGRTLAWLFLDVELDDPLASLLEDLDDFGLLADESGYRVMLNTLMIRAGFARKYTGVGSSDAERFEGEAGIAEELAEAEQRGLWAADACGG